MLMLRWFNRHIFVLKILVWILCAYPAWRLLYFYLNGKLGINGLEVLLHDTGFSALLLYIITLSITPLRRMLSWVMIVTRRQYGKRLGDWNWMVKLRRSLGVFCFLYGVLHFMLFFDLELDLDFSELMLEAQERPFIFAGLAALLLLLPLFLTSTDASMRRLKKNWRRLHRLMYPAGLLIALHYLWLMKPGVYDAWPYAILILLLLLFRVFDAFKIWFQREDDGMEAQR